MSEPARQTVHNDVSNRSFGQPGPLRDWLATMRSQTTESKVEAPVQEAAPKVVEAQAKPASSRYVVPQAAEQDDEVAEIVAENLMLKAKLRLEGERYDDLQTLLAQEVRELREHIRSEIESIDDMRAERDLWKARCEALMQPLFTA